MRHTSTCPYDGDRERKLTTSLHRQKLRQSWNKYNLFNIAKANLRQGRHGRTFFQQKWAAKSMTRGYHGAHIKETDWNRAFSRRLFSAPIHEMTPYMQMAYAPLERRLDVAIFRAMFASSTLQAKQFCTHGAVKVNGKPLDGTQVEAVPAEAGQQAEQQPKQSGHKEKAATEAITDLVSSKEVRKQVDGLSRDEQKALANLLRQDAENPIDESKPYWTPWEPRRYMAPFAFVPRYLEVNQNICAAVYLRHPVARRGTAEVPTPFPYETNQLAFNWYLRRH
ncbi:37S ribosomal protein S4-like, mitochondrial [Colletotrichum liriopes]|uniref:37S ribosomal protein S4-like, mitochondrial n=1 Tax=Colletotrichum liriopes TaxID=708192 RepID=A0AA37GCJ6_9PEZI|nr:37S ribosomal protein S4-like, mitochondrial [Colletotrichum liriopes]